MSEPWTLNQVQIPCGDFNIEGNLALPNHALGVILFAHGSGSSRFSSRNRFVANALNKANFATLLLDLLQPQEDQLIESRFDINLLTNRLWHAFFWLKTNEQTSTLPIGLFGASTGAAATLQLAGDPQLDARDEIFAIVLRGGRPDLANPEFLKTVRAPCLFLVGQNDEPVIAYNKKAFSQMSCNRSLQIIRGASHLFKEPGKLILVANQALDWYRTYVKKSKHVNHHV